MLPLCPSDRDPNKDSTHTCPWIQKNPLNSTLRSDGGRKEVVEMKSWILNQREGKEEILLPSASCDLCHTHAITQRLTPSPFTTGRRCETRSHPLVWTVTTMIWGINIKRKMDGGTPKHQGNTMSPPENWSERIKSKYFSKIHLIVSTLFMY